MKRQQRTPPPNPWSEWMNVAVGIGQVVVACELMFAAALSPAPATRRVAPRRASLVLVHSSGCTAGTPVRCGKRPALQSVPRRDEGKA